MTIANTDMANAWDGEEGENWTRHQAQYDATSRAYSERLLSVAGIGVDDRVLDVGCGCGDSTRGAARLAAGGMATGVDLSQRMIERARELAGIEGVKNVEFVQGDVQVHPFEPRAFDVVISRFGAMFFADPVAAFSNVRRAMAQGGHLALLAWRAFDHNEWLQKLRAALASGRTLPDPPNGAPGPFGLADPFHTRSVLTAAGFESVDLEDLRLPIFLGAGAADAFDFVSSMGITRGLLQDLDEPSAAAALDSLRATLAAHETPDGVTMASAAWLITAS